VLKTRGLNAIFERDLEKYNPTLKSILRVEDLFEKNIEFNSKNQLLLKLEGSMKAPVLNVILNYLKELGKITENDDGSWTWIYIAKNKKLQKSYKSAVRL
jgi:hypothetical protein